MARFYGHFAAAYGTFWFVLLCAALVSQSHIDAGAFGMIGFPLIALVYAAIRMGGGNRLEEENRDLRRRIQDLGWRLDRGLQPPPRDLS